MKISAISAFKNQKKQSLPYYESGVKAGFPSPADDHLRRRIDLNEELIAHPAATFLVRVEGESMKESGILNGDTLVVDRSLTASSGTVIVALLNGEFTVKYFQQNGTNIQLVAANTQYEPIHIKPSDDFEVWGVVTNAIHHLKNL